MGGMPLLMAVTGGMSRGADAGLLIAFALVLIVVAKGALEKDSGSQEARESFFSNIARRIGLGGWTSHCEHLFHSFVGRIGFAVIVGLAPRMLPIQGVTTYYIVGILSVFAFSRLLPRPPSHISSFS